MEPLNGRELGRLIAAVEGDTWQAKRDVAILNLMARLAAYLAVRPEWRGSGCS